ncbi:hypothetical protein GCM10019016_016990 [Streptomyces prasinosporus]|uniref:Secreted protein n=1 Tax=Streptomyces prasinosporus TaxID=68256 RepID=A0ABP6TJ25_9ACTN
MSLFSAFRLALAGLLLSTALLGTASAAAAVTPSPRSAGQGAADVKECKIWWSDFNLWCGHRVGAVGFADRTYHSTQRGQLYGDYGYFLCWGYGAQHAGGNNVWYWTQLDNGAYGNVAAADVWTPQDPFPGLDQC